MIDRVTPETAGSDEHVVGRRFLYAGNTFYCEWYDARYGYEMVQVAADSESNAPLPDGYRTNVSERAIGRTFHRVYPAATPTPQEPGK